MFKACLLSLTLIAVVFSEGLSQKVRRSYPSVSFDKVGESLADTLLFTAAVKSIYECPPCPEGAQCKPCIGDHVMVTNGNSELDFRVFTHQLSLFTVGQSFKFLVRFRSQIHRTNNIELVELVK